MKKGGRGDVKDIFIEINFELGEFFIFNLFEIFLSRL